MPARPEIEEMLTGPGGMFEVATETVDGVEMKVFKSRLPSLRDVASIGQARGEAEDFIVYGDRRYPFGTFVALANSVSNSLRDKFGVGHGDRVAVLSSNNPAWCLPVCGTVHIGWIPVGL